MIAARWEVELIYLALPTVELCKRRVAERVAHGGHNIPVQDIERRFPRSLSNLFEHYLNIVTRTRCFINHFKEPEIVFEFSDGNLLIHHKDHFEKLKMHSLS